MNVEELEVIAPDSDDKVIEVTDALPKVPDMLGVDSDDGDEVKAVATDCDDDAETLIVLEVADEDGEVKKAEPKAEVADSEVAVEPKAEPKGEVVDEEFLTQDDVEREAVLNEINEIADSADKSLNVKVPFIDKRSTKNSVIGKFLSLNKHLLSKKYHSLVDADVKLNGEMYGSMLDDVKVNVSALTKAQVDKAVARAVGFVDSGKGYYADINF